MVYVAHYSPQVDLEAIETRLVADLTRPRRITSQVEVNIQGQYDYETERFSDFLKDKYPQLEDYEADLVFSPLFTPTASDQLPYMPLLAQGHLSETDLDALISRLVARELTACFERPSGAQFHAPLHPVNLERYVKRLLLDKPLVDLALYDLVMASPLDKTGDETSRHDTLRVARDPIWHDAGRQAFLTDFVRVFIERGNWTLAKLNYLADFVRTYRPANWEDVRRQLESVVKSCQHDLENIANCVVIDPQLREVYSDSERAHLTDTDTREHYRFLMVQAEALLDDLDHLGIKSSAE